MKHISEQVYSNEMEKDKKKMTVSGAQTSKGELVVKGVATAVAAATIIETGKGVMKTLAKQPLVMFGFGIAAGFLTHKYRKEIILITSKTAEQGKDFVLKQKENIKDLIAESQEAEEGTDPQN
ncbi:hypothetical protein [Methylobacter sp.]|uniref:hypothetical protein n=1 Tax=Methylobacter sp. TaxID=2051955 RepID=UPI002FDE0B4B